MFHSAPPFSNLYCDIDVTRTSSSTFMLKRHLSKRKIPENENCRIQLSFPKTAGTKGTTKVKGKDAHNIKSGSQR
ncbi:hypothetical protein CEXT_144181 [Caerostris extrusa]|uniref:Uncharacterized protein n=1 Tax=Caerostris extrusa TaxID=172846 RepID=A0AAV4MMC6_CAEEX|nr:hypothetical protein CEXT_144181 [Caerostris extrusa]